MEIRGLNQFRAVVEAGGLTRAAELLHVTPGALSKSLKRFEEDLGHALFRRTRRNLVITEVGQRLYNASAPLLHEHARVLAQLREAAAPIPELLRLASFEPFSSAFAAVMLEEHLPHARVDLLEMLVGDIERAILERRIDYGLTYVPFPNRALAFRRLGRFEVAVYGAGASFEDLPFAQLPFAVPVNRVQLASGQRITIDGWPSERHPRNVKYRAITMQSAIELACRGLAVTCIPHFVAALHNTSAKRSRRLVRFANPAAVPRMYLHAHLVCREEDQAEPRTRELANIIKSTLTKVSALEVPLAKRP
jgi:DNA-binding transcriptional LysR family regulator